MRGDSAFVVFEFVEGEWLKKTSEQGGGGEKLERGDKPFVVVAVTAELRRGNKGDRPGVGAFLLWGNIVVKRDEVNPVVKKVRREHIVQAPWGTTVMDVLSQDEDEFGGRRGTGRAQGRDLFHCSCVGIIVFFDFEVVRLKMIETLNEGGNVHRDPT